MQMVPEKVVGGAGRGTVLRLRIVKMELCFILALVLII